MSNHARKLDANRRRGQKHRDKRASKRRETQSHHKETPRSQRRRSNVLQFPKEWQGLFQSNRRKIVAA